LQLDEHLFNSLISNELFALTHPSLQRSPSGRKRDNNFRFLFQKVALTRPSLQLCFCVGFYGIFGACGFVPQTSDDALSSFSNRMDFDPAKLSGNPAYWPDSQDRLQVFAAATIFFLHVGTRSFHNSVGS
jgi:hypothetical protein